MRQIRRVYSIDMKYYACYSFSRSPISQNSYTLDSKVGLEVPGMYFKKYAETPKNYELGICGKDYVYFTEPRDPRIAQYFAHTFEGKDGKVITSVEELDHLERTFGDAKKMNLNDLILIQFSEDRNKLKMWFVKDKGISKAVKQKTFLSWCNGEELVPDERLFAKVIKK